MSKTIQSVDTMLKKESNATTYKYFYFVCLFFLTASFSTSQTIISKPVTSSALTTLNTRKPGEVIVHFDSNNEIKALEYVTDDQQHGKYANTQSIAPSITIAAQSLPSAPSQQNSQSQTQGQSQSTGGSISFSNVLQVPITQNQSQTQIQSQGQQSQSQGQSSSYVNMPSVILVSGSGAGAGASGATAIGANHQIVATIGGPPQYPVVNKQKVKTTHIHVHHHKPSKLEKMKLKFKDKWRHKMAVNSELVEEPYSEIYDDHDHLQYILTTRKDGTKVYERIV